MTMKAIFMLAVALPAAVAQPSTATAIAVVSNTDGGQASVNTTGGGTGVATVTVGGRTKTVGVTGTRNSTGTHMASADVDTASVPTMVSLVATDPTEGVAPSPAMSPGPAGEEGAARLVDRVDINGYAMGTLQVFCEGAWGAVCSTNFDDVDATVACRQLGFDSGLAGVPVAFAFPVTRVPSMEIRAPFVLENLGCAGNESRLVDCPADGAAGSGPSLYDSTYYGTADTCDPFLDAFASVACGTSATAGEGDLRLANGVAAADGSAEYGRLEVFFNGGWGTVCDSAAVNSFRRFFRFTDGSVAVACRQLGFLEGFQIARLEDLDEARTERVPIVLGGASCDGSEAGLADCASFRFGRTPSFCGHVADVHLVCFNGPDPGMDGATRLEDGSADPAGQWEYGRLEIFARGFWSNVCNNGGFTPDAAQVACRALGYAGGAELRFNEPFLSSSPRSPVLFKSLPVALAAVDCDGSESSISECQSNNRQIARCGDDTSSTVLACANASSGCDIQDGTTEGSVRLRGGFGTPCDPVYTGFIEVLHDDEWGAICTDRGKLELVADVVCRQLGFPHGTHVDPFTAQALPPEDTAMNPSSPYDYYLDYRYVAYGSVEEEAEEPADRFWLNSVVCDGPETALTQCDLGPGFLQNNAGCPPTPTRVTIACRQFPVVEALEAVQTPDAEEGDLRLIDQADIDNWTTGRLQVFFEGSWSQVCAGNFNAPDANVACRQLGFGAGTVVPAAQALSTEQLDEFDSTNIFPEAAITNAQCTGTEARLVDCGTAGAQSDYDYEYLDYDRDCISSVSDGLVLGCVAAPLQGSAAGAEGALRITNKTAEDAPGAEAGVLEIFHAGAWGTLCNGFLGFPQSTAELICRDMGFVSGVFQDVVSSGLILPPWLSGIQCSGDEAGPAECQRSAFGETGTCGPPQRIICSTRQGTGEAQLVQGNADPEGAWEYGVLQVMANGLFSNVQELSGESLGRRGVEVACRSLGYATGGQLIVGDNSPFITASTALNTIAAITCDGSEAGLGDCDFDVRVYGYGPNDYVGDYGELVGAVALICATPSGCSDPDVPPAEGDVRLVPLNGSTAATQACDDVHLGAVELFREGRWGGICAGLFGGQEEEFTLDAQVVCRQLGFTFGTVMDAEEIYGVGDYVDYSERESQLVWASQVVCTGKEERLLDCVFPENFGIDYREYTYDYVNGDPPAPASSDSEPAPAAIAGAPAPSNGLPNTGCSRVEGDRLAVICRRFEITESDFIRR